MVNSSSVVVGREAMVITGGGGREGRLHGGEGELPPHGVHDLLRRVCGGGGGGGGSSGARHPPGGGIERGLGERGIREREWREIWVFGNWENKKAGERKKREENEGKREEATQTEGKGGNLVRILMWREAATNTIIHN